MALFQRREKEISPRSGARSLAPNVKLSYTHILAFLLGGSAVLRLVSSGVLSYASLNTSKFKPDTTAATAVPILQQQQKNQQNHHHEESDHVARNTTTTTSEPPPVAWPILVMGMPKTATTTISSFFNCGKRHTVSHWVCREEGGGDRAENQCGFLVQHNIEAGLPPLANTGTGKSSGKAADFYDVYAQLDAWAKGGGPDRDVCYIPQIESIQELHDSYPNATWILNTRTPEKWISSMRRFAQGFMATRMVNCNITGMPRGRGDGDEELKDFYISHNNRIRSFAAAHPTHRLVEINIEDPNSGPIMAQAFGINETCWGHKNKS